MRRLLPHRRRTSRLVALALGGALLLSACGSSGPTVVTITTTPGVGGAPVTAPTLSSSTDAAEEPSSATEQTPPPATTTSPASAAMRVSANPAFGSKNVGPTDPIVVTVFNSELEKVTMLGDDGSSIAGKITNDKHTWTKSERLKYGVTYTVTGTAKAADGSEHPVEGTFTTVKPTSTMAAYVNIPDGSTVGIAAPIIITFAGTVKDRAAAERALTVTTTDASGKKSVVVGSWGWMQDEDIQGKGVKQSRVHFRPARYWPAGTRVHVSANLYGTNYGGAWGRDDIARNFKIGPAMRVVADVPSHKLLVTVDDVIVKNFPVAYGKESVPGRNTVSGIHVITDKYPTFSMCNPKYDYCNVTEHWAVRINNNGEFIHANPLVEKAGLLGKANVSHGCVNMSMANAKTFYDMVYYGVPVVVTGTKVKMSYSDYIWDWSVSYDQWKSFSAL